MHKLNKSVFIFAILFFILSSCDKDKKHALGQSQSGLSKTISGTFDISKKFNLYGDSLGKAYGYSHVKIFNVDVDVDSINYKPGIDVGTVKINSVIFKKFPFNNQYIDTSNAISYPQFVLNVSGNQTFNPFNEIFNQSYPSYLGYKILPDTVFLNSNCIIKVNKFSNCNRIEVQIRATDGTQVNKILSNTDSIVSFTQSELAPFVFASVPVAEINISMFYTTQKRINSRLYFLRTCIVTGKKSVILD
jgi:hypothetical protein